MPFCQEGVLSLIIVDSQWGTVCTKPLQLTLTCNNKQHSVVYVMQQLLTHIDLFSILITFCTECAKCQQSSDVSPWS